MNFFAIINVLAVCVIAYYAFSSHRFANNSHEREKEFRKDLTKINQKHQQELRDLYQAIVIATIPSGPRSHVDNFVGRWEGVVTNNRHSKK